MSTWYVIDTRTNEIINAISTSDNRKPELRPESWIDCEHLRLDANPPLSQLQRYRYWDERP